jgi:hypothetical protein
LTLANKPTNGNLLVACISIRDSSVDFVGTTVINITQPGVIWTLAGINNQENSPGFCNQDVEVWTGQVKASASASLTVNFSRAIAGTTPAAVIDCCEFKGASNVVEQTGSNFNVSSSTGDTGTTPKTVSPVQLFIGAISFQPTSITNTQTNPTNGFTLLNGLVDDPGGELNLAFVFKIVLSVGPANCRTTFSVAQVFVGLIVTLVAAPLAAPQTYGDGLTSYTC